MLKSFGIFAATAFVVTCMTTLISEYGKNDQKGIVLGIFRSIGALARALGPIFASIGKKSFLNSLANYVTQISIKKHKNNDFSILTLNNLIMEWIDVFLDRLKFDYTIQYNVFLKIS